MSKSPNKTLIGAFTAGAVVLLVTAVAVFGSGKLFKSDTAQFVMFFEKSISGLNIGSPVMFRGVPIGRVTAIRLTGDIRDMTFRIPVYVELGNRTKIPLGVTPSSGEELGTYLDRLVAHGLRARLSSQSLLTGQLMIEMDFFPPSEAGPRLLKAGEFEGIPEIPTIPSRLDSVWHKISTMPVDEIAATILSISQQINLLLEKAELVQLVGNANELVQQVQKAVTDFDGALGSFKTVGNKYGRLADGFSARLDKALVRLDKTLAAFGSAAGEAQQTLTSTRSVVGQNSVTVLELNRMLREVAEAARSLRSLAGTLQRNPEALLFGKGSPLQ